MQLRKGKKKAVAKHIELPREILIGKGVLKEIDRITENYKDILIVTGRKTNKVAGNKIKKRLKCERVFVEKPNMDNVEKVQDAIKYWNADLVVAAGGGKVIDVTKLAAFKSGIDFVSVPTTCSNDGIASPFVSLRNSNGSVSMPAKMPICVIADVDIIKKSPRKMVRAGIGDIIAKNSAVLDWKLGAILGKEYYGDYAGALSLMTADVVTDNVAEIKKRSERGINIMMEALISSGAAMGIAGSSRPASGSEHKFSHALDIVANFPAIHGEQCGVATILSTYLQGKNWHKIQNVLESASCPVTAKGLNVDRDIMLNAMIKAKGIRPERYTIIDHIKLDRSIAKNALDATGVA